MNEDAEIKEGIYLSESGLAKVRDIFSAYSSGDISYLKGLHDEVHYSTFTREWSTFDDAYRDIYYLSIASENRLVSLQQDIKRADNKQKRADLTIIFDFNFPRIRRDLLFQHSLIDETKVADLIRLRRGVTNLIPYETSLSTFAVGCLWLEFSIFANSRTSDHDEGLIGIGPNTLERSPGWQRFKRRFHLANDCISFRYTQ